jgi:glycosyltransferase involved in cell wall biosynthesis
MKLLYIVPKIKIAGGVARVTSVKANYFVEHFGYEIHILSQNEGDTLPFYDFNSKIVFHYMTLKGRGLSFFVSFQKDINKKVKEIKPDVILIADNGLKAFIYPFVCRTKIPMVLECHGSKFIEEKDLKADFLAKSIRKIKYQFKDFGARKFTRIVTLSGESLKEWNVENGVVIPNPLWIKNNKISNLQHKKVIAIGRYSFEKGLDRLLLIWKEIIQKHSDWTLDIYTDNIHSLKEKALDLGLEWGINYLDFVKNIEEKYYEASIYAMTSRTEGFAMVLLEAMASGLSCIAYDCPIGPRALITSGENGFLIPDDCIEIYVEQLSFLIEDQEIRSKLGKKAQAASENYAVDKVMEQWKSFLEKTVIIN